MLTLGVESESPDETVSLVAATLVSLPEGERAAVLARTVVARGIDALIQIAAADEPLRIVTTFSPGDIAHRATCRGHRVLIPRSRLHRDAAERELKAMGLPDDRARELAGLARRSLAGRRRGAGHHMRLATNVAEARKSTYRHLGVSL